MTTGSSTPETLRPRGDGPESSAGDPDGSAARVLDERESIAEGSAPDQPGTGSGAQRGERGADVAEESGYTTELEQGASQRP